MNNDEIQTEGKIDQQMDTCGQHSESLSFSRRRQHQKYRFHVCRKMDGDRATLVLMPQQNSDGFYLKYYE